MSESERAAMIEGMVQGLADRLREQKSVLVVPGDHFGMDRFLRISFGLPHDYLLPALERIRELIEEVRVS